MIDYEGNRSLLFEFSLLVLHRRMMPPSVRFDKNLSCQQSFELCMSDSRGILNYSTSTHAEKRIHDKFVDKIDTTFEHILIGFSISKYCWIYDMTRHGAHE